MNPLHELIRRMPAGVEFLVVVSWAFGLPVFSSIMALGTGGESGGGTGARRCSTTTRSSTSWCSGSCSRHFSSGSLHVRGWTLEKVRVVHLLAGHGAGVADAGP